MPSSAETTAGGIAHWATSQVAGDLRTNATDYQKAWTPYIQAVAKAVIPNQITNGGPIIGTPTTENSLPISHAILVLLAVQIGETLSSLFGSIDLFHR